MKSINEINAENINNLSDIHLVELLGKLLYLEAFNHKIPTSGVSVPLNITVADGGEDGRIEWSDGIEKTNWIPNRFTIFQVKATKMEPADCKKELFSNKTLKPKVSEVFDKKGHYILFNNYSLNKDQIDERIKKSREALNESGRTDYEEALIDVYDSHKIANWVNEYQSAVVFVLECLNIKRDKIFKTWEEWKKYFSEDFQYKFIRTSTIDSYIEKIIDISKKVQSNLRIVGLSGLGKTRLVLEAFRIIDESDLEKKFLNNSIVYCDIKDLDYSSLQASVSSLCEQNSKGILVVDNCNLITHRKLKKELRDSKIVLITLNFDPEDIEEDSSDPYIVLNPNKFDDLIPKLLNEVFPGINEVDSTRIKDFSQGFPLMTVLLGKGKIDEISNLGKLNDKELIDRLLQIEDDDTEPILCACAIFESFGYDAELAEDRNFIASNIVKIKGSQDEKKDKFYSVCEKYIGRGILEKSGRRVFLKPKPLALTLAAKWWQNFRPESANDLLNLVKTQGLTEQLCRQMSKLDFLPKAREITSSLCGKQGPFGQAEILNTEEGSRIFRALVEVNPLDTVIALERAFSNFNKDNFLEIKAGRRNLVWALEKLCFRKETFYKATKILFYFSIAENEPYGNNATNQFTQLFLILLPGTEANFVTRLDLLKELSETDNIEELKLILKAIKAGLNTIHFSRPIGAENQGSSLTLRDYEPTKEEVSIYQKSLLDIIKKILIDFEDLFEDIYQIIVDIIRDVSHIGNFNFLEDLIKEIIEKKQFYAPDLLNSLSLTLRFEILDENDKEKIKNLISSLKGITIENRIKTIVTNRIIDWMEQQDECGKYVDKNKIDAELLATELVNKTNWFEYLKNIYEGEQQQAYNFGNKLGSLAEETFAKKFIDISIKVLKTISKEKRTPDVLAHFLFAYKDKSLVKTILEQIINDDTLFENAFYIFTISAPDYETIEKLFVLIKNKNLPIKSFNYLRFGNAFYSLNTKEKLAIIEEISSYGLEGEWVAITLSYVSLQNNTDDFSSYLETIKNLVLKETLLLDSIKIDPAVSYPEAWKSLVLKLLKDSNDEILIKNITKNIIHFFKENYKWGHFTYEIKSIIDYLFDKNFEVSWELFGKALLDNDSGIYLILRNIIGADNGISTKKDGILFKEKNYEYLINWCKNNLPNSARYIAGMLPVYKLYQDDELIKLYKQNEKLKDVPLPTLKRNEIDIDNPFHPFAKTFIDQFGNDEIVLSEFSSKLGSYGYIGSGIPMLENRKKILEELQGHNLVKVREWARKEITYINELMKKTKIIEDEMFM